MSELKKIELLIASRQSVFTTQDLGLVWQIADRRKLFEIIKYYLRLKAEEAAPEAAELSIAYAGFGEGAGAKKLLFHIKGMKADEVAVLPISRDYYEKMKADKARIKQTEPFDRIFKGQYRSLRILEAEVE